MRNKAMRLRITLIIMVSACTFKRHDSVTKIVRAVDHCVRKRAIIMARSYLINLGTEKQKVDCSGKGGTYVSFPYPTRLLKSKCWKVYTTTPRQAGIFETSCSKSVAWGRGAMCTVRICAANRSFRCQIPIAVCSHGVTEQEMLLDSWLSVIIAWKVGITGQGQYVLCEEGNGLGRRPKRISSMQCFSFQAATSSLLVFLFFFFFSSSLLFSRIGERIPPHVCLN